MDLAEKEKNPHMEHRKRLRKTFRKVGAEDMPEHNVLELLLFYSIPIKDTNGLAHKLINRFGSLNGVFDASYEQLLEVEGVGENTALLLSLIPSVCRRYAEGKRKGKIKLTEPSAVAEYMTEKYYGIKNEIVYMLFLDATGTLINCCKIAEGIPNQVAIDKMTVIEAAIRAKADKVIMVHNHPSGVAAPSRHDLETTSEIKSMFRELGIVLADHIIITEDDYLSLASLPKFSTFFI